MRRIGPTGEPSGTDSGWREYRLGRHDQIEYVCSAKPIASRSALDFPNSRSAERRLRRDENSARAGVSRMRKQMAFTTLTGRSRWCRGDC